MESLTTQELDHWLRREFLALDSPLPKMAECEHCKQPFALNRAWQTHCSARCRAAKRRNQSIEHLRRMDEQRDELEADLEAAHRRIAELEQELRQLR